MPQLDTPLHLRMLRGSRRAGQIKRDGIYGLQWGNPQDVPFLRHVRDRFIIPYVNPDHTAIEIGPGGGRWTRYMLGFGTLHAVDYHHRLLRELTRSFRAPHLQTIKNNGADFPGVPDKSVDFIFSFGVFVHLDANIIAAYLREMHRVMKPGAFAVIQYSDKNKQQARETGESFADTTPEIIRPLVADARHQMVEEDTESLPHSSIIRFTPI